MGLRRQIVLIHTYHPAIQGGLRWEGHNCKAILDKTEQNTILSSKKREPEKWPSSIDCFSKGLGLIPGAHVLALNHW